MRTINLCGRPGACPNCPEVHVSDDKKEVNITDDHGHIVYMTGEQFEKLKTVVL